MRACGGRWEATECDPAAGFGATDGRGLRRAVFLWAGVLGMLVATASGAARAAGDFQPVAPLAVRDAMGAGIHAFHMGDFQVAYDKLTSSILAGIEDPRAYYFRGLAGLRIGRLDESEADFASAAELEASTGSTRRVSLALERVQGQDRLTLERFRTRARLAKLAQERDARGRRYSGIEDAAPDVRRRRRPEDVLPELVAPGPESATDEPAAAPMEEVPAPRTQPPSTKSKAPPAGEPGRPRVREKAKPAAAADDPFADESEDAELEGEVEASDDGK